ncbi:MAG: type IV toxin-antitoxin system AbiEi family antitoxin [Bacteroidota bacterium]
MSTDNGSKINQLLQSFPSGTVILSSWLGEKGYSHELQKRYRKSNWLESIGTGAMIRKGDHVTYEGAIYALQKQAHLSIHPGGRTALSIHGKAHYLELSAKSVVLFGAPEEQLPAWFRSHQWEYSTQYYRSGFLPVDLGYTAIGYKDFKYKISDPTRAMLECLYLVPNKQSLVECYEIMEGLNNLRPSHVQALLEQCSSVKVKRLFLYLAGKSGHAWLKHIQSDKIGLGKGKRGIVKGGVYDPEFQITVDKELGQEDERQL